MWKFLRKQRPILVEWQNPEAELRITDILWVSVAPVENQYIERAKKISILSNYIKYYGLRSVVLKVLSRLRESKRNKKICGVGTGRVLVSNKKNRYPVGTEVIFFAPNQREASSLISLDERFIFSLQELKNVSIPSWEEALSFDQACLSWGGWSPFSGVEIFKEDVALFLASQLEGKKVDFANKKTSFNYVERLQSAAVPGKRKKAVIFGLGNYAKTQIIPNIQRHLDICCVHEIDIDQVVYLQNKRITLDVSPYPREEEFDMYDAFFVASFHHMHAQVVLQAIQREKYVVVEKPLATTMTDYLALLKAIKQHPEFKLFCCFQKRYSPLNVFLRKDLKCEKGAPIDMSASVYEIPLPKKHWYNWPNSRSRVISNGCHWIDYFLFVNDYVKLEKFDVIPGNRGFLSLYLSLVNGANMSMSLTEIGSGRLGVRENLEFRHGDVTAHIIDSSYYQAENSSKILRKKKVNPHRAYINMYKTIAQKIAQGLPGDATKTLYSSEVAMEIDKELLRRV